MMRHVEDRLRQARAALDRGEHRRTIQLCEQLRANERLSAAELAEVFALLGRAHVALGEHETAIAFLKRAERDPRTLAAASEAHAALGIALDASAFFAQADARRARRIRQAVIGAIAGLVVIGGCGLYLSSWAIWLWMPSTIDEGFEAASAEGAARGRSGDVATCERAFLAGLLACPPLDELGDEQPDACALAFVSFYSCIQSTSGWDAYCEGVPGPDPEGEAHAWARARCEAYAASHAVPGEQASDFVDRCEPQLVVMPAYCADPSWREGVE